MIVFSILKIVFPLSTNLVFFLFDEKSEIIPIFVLQYVSSLLSLTALPFSLYCITVFSTFIGMVFFVHLASSSSSFLDFHKIENNLAIFFFTHCFDIFFLFYLYLSAMYIWPLDIALQITKAFKISFLFSFLVILFFYACASI